MILYTEHAVRRKGMGTTLTECVMCLVDGDHVPATHMVDLGEAEAAYCAGCAQTMKNNGFTIGLISNPDPATTHDPKKTKQAETMIRQGYAVATVAERTGLDRLVVSAIKKRIRPFEGKRERSEEARIVRESPTVKRERIETLIEEELAGVSTNTVQRIKREAKEDGVYSKALGAAKKELADIQPQIDRLLQRSRSLESVIQALEAM